MFRLIGLAAAAAVFAASAATAQSGTGQADLKAQLEAARAPLFNSGKPVPGFTASYSVVPGNCTTRVEILVPTHLIDGQPHAGSTETREIDWRAAVSVALSNNYVVVKTPAKSAGDYYFAVSPQGAQRMKAMMDGLAAACRTGAAAPASAPAARPAVDYAARTALPPDILGHPRCAFPAVPGLAMTQRDRPYVGSAMFIVNAQGSDENTQFTLGVSESDSVSNWHGTLSQDPRFRITDRRLGQNKIARAAITLDGKPFAVPMTFLQNKGYDLPWSPTVIIAPSYYSDQDKWFALLEKGALATVYLYDGSNNRFGPWTFDVSAFRNIPAAIKGSRFRCR